jgi:ribonuclease HII
MRLSLAQIKLRYVIEGKPLDAATEAALEADARTGAQAILQAVRRRRFDNRSEGQRLRKLLRYERALWSAGIVHVAGVDEAGMSPLAGPVAAAAVIFKPGSRIPGINDSKQLDPSAREQLAAEIKQTAAVWSVGFADVEEIDSINIYWAGLQAMRRAVEGLSRAPAHVLVDALWLCQAQGLPGGRASHRAEAAWCVADPPAVVWTRPGHPRLASSSALAKGGRAWRLAGASW